MEQRLLFDLPPPLPANLPPGFAYHRDFLDDDEERELLEVIRSLPLEAARYKGYTARRRVVSFGGSFDYDSNRLLPAAELDSRLHPLRDRVCAWLGVASSGRTIPFTMSLPRQRSRIVSRAVQSNDGS